jgi:hypothetical protein
VERRRRHRGRQELQREGLAFNGDLAAGVLYFVVGLSLHPGGPGESIGR